MKFYKEITLLEQAEISPYFIWSKLFTQLHICLAENKDENEKVNIGVSFPEYTYSQGGSSRPSTAHLGFKIRLFAENKVDLEKLDVESWLSKLNGYLAIDPIAAVPENILGYVTFSRMKPTDNAKVRRLARHRAKKDGISYESALELYQHLVEVSRLPYVKMLSLSTSTQQSKNNFNLFIKKEAAEKTDTQVFSTYGLSSESSVPEF